MVTNCDKLSTCAILVDQQDKIIAYSDGTENFFDEHVLQNKNIASVLSSAKYEICTQKINLNPFPSLGNIKCIYLVINFLQSENLLNLNCLTMKKILDNCHDEIFVTNGEGTSIYANKAAEKHYGSTRQDLIGKTSWQLADEGYCSPPVTPLVLSEKKKVTIEQKTRTGKNLVVTGTPVLNSAGEIELIVENSRDITELVDIKQNLEAVKNLLEKYKREVEELRRKELTISDDLIASSKQMQELSHLLNTIASADSTVLILGESGTGKSLIAKYIHKMSSRSNGPFITINCAAIPEQLLESEFFGYTPGAFSGASKEGKVGLFELAHGGTLFLDEIAEIPLKLQAKLLQVIQDRHFTPVGGVEEKEIDVRIITATNQNLKKMVQDKEFREDLYYRINVIEVEVPPLRERIEDIIPLTYFFLEKYDKKYGKSHQFDQKTLDILLQYSWPGNVRELEHLIERLVVTVNKPTILPEHLPKFFQNSDEQNFHVSFPTLVPFDDSVELFEKKLITKAYQQLKSTYKIAEALQISQSKAYRLIKKYIR